MVLCPPNYRVKVDREERPDIDHVYMLVCQALTGQGGWPLSIFLTPEGKPFFAGTYFPKRKRMGMSGFVELLTQIASLWQNDRARILRSGEEVTQAIQPRGGPMSEEHTLGQHTLQKGYEGLARSFDPKWGGFGNAPKFPLPHQLTFLLRWHRHRGDAHALAMVEKTLDSMRRGGIFDQIGFGFHRYSVDEKWLVPHFEKMLYDQALLAMAYTEAYQATGNKSHAAVVHEILSYVLQEMTSPEGGFYSAEDADSEGKEGLFYLWKPDEIKRCLGDEMGGLFCDFYDISERGNFENGYSIPRVPLELKNFVVHKGMDTEELDARLRGARERIFDLRKKRVHPLKDDKVLTSWNGLMIAALAKAFCATGEPAYSGAACRAADFIIRNMKKAEGRLYHRYREGETVHHAFLDDYAFLVWGYIELYEATFEVRYLEEALAMNAVMLELFWDESAGGLFFTGPDNEALIVRTKDIQDGALPSGNSVAVMNLSRLGRMTGNIELEEKADQLAQAFAGEIASYPVAYTQILSALDFMFGPSQEIVIAGNAAQESTRAMIEAVHRMFLPNKVLVFRPEGDEGDRLSAISPLLATLRPLENRPTVYLCEKHACKTPIFDIEELKSALTTKESESRSRNPE